MEPALTQQACWPETQTPRGSNSGRLARRYCSACGSPPNYERTLSRVSPRLQVWARKVLYSDGRLFPRPEGQEERAWKQPSTSRMCVTLTIVERTKRAAIPHRKTLLATGILMKSFWISKVVVDEKGHIARCYAKPAPLERPPRCVVCEAERRVYPVVIESQLHAAGPSSFVFADMCGQCQALGHDVRLGRVPRVLLPHRAPASPTPTTTPTARPTAPQR